MSYHAPYQRRQGFLWGLLLIAVGGLLLMDNFGWIETGSLWGYWPFIFVLFGINKIFGYKKPKHIAEGVGLIGWGLWIYACIHHVWGLSFFNSWPLILIGIGLTMILKSILNLTLRPKEFYESSSF